MISKSPNPSEVNEKSFKQSKMCMEDEIFQKIVISGASVGLPGLNKNVFENDNISKIINGTNFIDQISEIEQKKVIDKNVKKVIKDDSGNRTTESLSLPSQIHKLAGLKGYLDLEKQYGVPKAIISTLDKTYELAIAAGIEALRDAKIPLLPVDGNIEKNLWELPKEYQNTLE